MREPQPAPSREGSRSGDDGAAPLPAAPQLPMNGPIWREPVPEPLRAVLMRLVPEGGTTIDENRLRLALTRAAFAVAARIGDGLVERLRSPNRGSWNRSVSYYRVRQIRAVIESAPPPHLRQLLRNDAPNFTHPAFAAEVIYIFTRSKPEFEQEIRAELAYRRGLSTYMKYAKRLGCDDALVQRTTSALQEDCHYLKSILRGLKRGDQPPPKPPLAEYSDAEIEVLRALVQLPGNRRTVAPQLGRPDWQRIAQQFERDTGRKVSAPSLAQYYSRRISTKAEKRALRAEWRAIRAQKLEERKAARLALQDVLATPPGPRKALPHRARGALSAIARGLKPWTDDEIQRLHELCSSPDMPCRGTGKRLNTKWIAEQLNAQFNNERTGKSVSTRLVYEQRTARRKQK